jgi:hypothetical protein
MEGLNRQLTGRILLNGERLSTFLLQLKTAKEHLLLPILFYFIMDVLSAK